MHQEPSLATLLLAERITTKTLAIIAARFAQRIGEIDGRPRLEAILAEIAGRQHELVVNPATLGVILEPGLDEHEALALARRDLVELIVYILRPPG